MEIDLAQGSASLVETILPHLERGRDSAVTQMGKDIGGSLPDIFKKAARLIASKAESSPGLAKRIDDLADGTMDHSEAMQRLTQEFERVLGLDPTLAEKVRPIVRQADAGVVQGDGGLVQGDESVNSQNISVTGNGIFAGRDVNIGPVNPRTGR